jgi:hypothetical protein
VNALRTKLALHNHLHLDERRVFRDSAHRMNCAVVEKSGMGIFMYESHEFVLISERRGGATRGNAKLDEDVADMPSHGLFADA